MGAEERISNQEERSKEITQCSTERRGGGKHERKAKRHGYMARKKKSNMHLIGVPDGIEGNGQQDKTERKDRSPTKEQQTDTRLPPSPPQHK